jgi:hypothetical protein
VIIEREKEGERERERERKKEQKVRAISKSSCGRALSVPHSVSIRDYYINAVNYNSKRFYSLCPSVAFYLFELLSAIFYHSSKANSIKLFIIVSHATLR